jgi:predicted transglutaminase-like cysteine proteinase
MRVLIVLGLALLLTVPVPQCFAAASGREAPPVPDGHGGGADAALAPTLPPVGFVEFCARNPARCSPAAAAGRIAMSEDRWRMVYRLNSLVNGQIAPESDQILYGEAEYWAYPTVAGDCEDYVLLKQHYLERLGFPRSGLLITVVLDEANEGHAVLTLRTAEGDFVLDNRHNAIRRMSDADYTFLKRQSERDPRQWVSLMPGGKLASAQQR